MNIQSIASAIFAVLIAAPGLAQQSITPRPVGGTVSTGTKLPWSITDDERITLRQGHGPNHRTASLGATQRGFSEHIEGREHPELLLPVELFDNLLRGIRADAKLRGNARRLYDQKIRAFGYEPDAFWNRLRTAANDYIAVADTPGKHRGATDFVTPSGRKLWIPMSRDLCSARFTSLQEARRLFGKATFDRFLYSVVAPEVNFSATGSVSNEDHAEQLRYMAGGCK